MKTGMGVEEAVAEAVNDMRALKGGLIGRVTIHAIDTQGLHAVVAVNGTPENHYWIWRSADERPVIRPARIESISADQPPKPTASFRYGNLR